MQNVQICCGNISNNFDLQYYTERYMGSLDENFKGYNESSPLWRLEPLRRKPYFLLHGTKDDNVHFQNSMLIR